MDLMDAMTQGAKGMKAQTIRMRIISENIANADTTAKSADETPYQRKVVTFKSQMDKASGQEVVSVDKVMNDKAEFEKKYDPSHPAADKNGYIQLPNVNPMIEMMDMREAQRSYEANIGVIDIAKAMLMRTLDLLSR